MTEETTTRPGQELVKMLQTHKVTIGLVMQARQGALLTLMCSLKSPDNSQEQ